MNERLPSRCLSRLLEYRNISIKRSVKLLFAGCAVSLTMSIFLVPFGTSNRNTLGHVHSAVLCSLTARFDFIRTSIALWCMEYTVTREKPPYLSLVVFHVIHVEVPFQLPTFLIDPIRYMRPEICTPVSLLNVCRRLDFESVCQVEQAIGVASTRS